MTVSDIGLSGTCSGATPKRLAARLRDALGTLFPVAPDPVPRSRRAKLTIAALEIAAVVVLAFALLFRIADNPAPWNQLYLDDYGTFFTDQLQHPWNLLQPARGYVQVLPHLIAQLIVYIPLIYATKAFALTGALITAASGLFVYHASAGHIHSRILRIGLGLAIIGLPIAPLDILDNGVGTPWFLFLALFWAVLWRPRTRAGIAITGLVALTAAASTDLCVLFILPLAIRLYVLRRPKDHAVTIGWFLGCLVQALTLIRTYLHPHAKLLGIPGTPSHSLAFYAQDVVGPSLGWRLWWWVQSLSGRDPAAALYGVVLLAVFAVILYTQPRSRAFVLTALLFGFIETMFTETTTWYNIVAPPLSLSYEPGSRYTALPIFLIQSALLVALDYSLRQRRARQAAATAATVAPTPGPIPAKRPALAPLAAALALVLVVVCAASWAADFRYFSSFRANDYAATGYWPVVVNQWHLDCEESKTGIISIKDMTFVARHFAIPCARLNFTDAPTVRAP